MVILLERYQNQQVLRRHELIDLKIHTESLLCTARKKGSLNKLR